MTETRHNHSIEPSKTVESVASPEATKPERIIKNLDLDKEFESYEELSLLSFGEGVNQSLAMYRWLFDENPYNPRGQNMMYVMKEGEQIIGSDGLLPFELQVGDRTVLSAHSVKSMTHPDFKRQGIFKTMTLNSLAKAKEHNLSVVIGLANKASYPAYEKFGWPTLYERDIYIRPINIYNPLRKKLKLSFLAGIGATAFLAYDGIRLWLKKAKVKKYRAKMHIEVPESAGACFDRYRTHFKIMIVRDYKYLNYRYNKRPDVKYDTITIEDENDQVVAFAVLRVVKLAHSTMVSVAENFANPKDEKAVEALTNAMIEYACTKKADYIVASCGKHEPFPRIFRAFGFQTNKKPLSNNMMIACATSDSFDMHALAGYENWFITQGDGETELDF